MVCPRIARNALELKGDTDTLEIVDNLLQLWQATGDLPTNKTFGATYEFLGVFPDYMKKRYGFKDEEDNLVLRGYSELYFDKMHGANPPLPIEDIHCPGGSCAGCTDPQDICTPGDSMVGFPTDEEFGLNKHDGAIGFLEWQDQELVCWSLCDLDPSVDKQWNEDGYRWGLSSYTRQLSLWAHVFADIHMPLHVGGISTSTCFPDGDDSGHAIELTKDSGENGLYKKIYEQAGPSELHQLWDSMIWYEGSVDDDIEAQKPRTGFFPHYADLYETSGPHNLLEIDAIRIMDQHPEDSFDSSLIEASYLDVAKESHYYSRTVALNVSDIPYGVWGGCDKPEDRLAFDPTDDYIRRAHDLVIRQMAICGYRMAHRLPLIVDKIPIESLIESVRAGFSTTLGQKLCETCESRPTFIPQQTTSTSVTTTVTTTYSTSESSTTAIIVPSAATFPMTIHPTSMLIVWLLCVHQF
eukprot:GHVP01027279.1.p1 GENE.GHVP01027279.1~~GHVP01027279.1.p1  ORF type:complete len:467 (+),score=50.27 GHVP01027279.1:541-1941(+)